MISFGNLFCIMFTFTIGMMCTCIFKMSIVNSKEIIYSFFTPKFWLECNLTRSPELCFCDKVRNIFKAPVPCNDKYDILFGLIFSHLLEIPNLEGPRHSPSRYSVDICRHNMRQSRLEGTMQLLHDLY